MTAAVNLHVVDTPNKDKDVPTKNVYLDKTATPTIEDGSITADKLAAGVLPTNATKDTPGLVKQMSKLQSQLVFTPDADDAAGATPTKEEFDKVVALANACKETLQTLQNNLLVSGQMASH